MREVEMNEVVCSESKRFKQFDSQSQETKEEELQQLIVTRVLSLYPPLLLMMISSLLFLTVAVEEATINYYVL